MEHGPAGNGTRSSGHGHRGADGSGADEIHLPSPTIWPVVCAAGVALLAFGVLTHPVFSALGLLATARALAGWIEELRHE